jgi:regulator of protease activity HflC (stomatin/prohibitin superfamily)
MEKQMRAERDRRAKILEAEGLKKSMILEAEGFKESQINKAEGEKQAEILKAEGDAFARIKRAEGESEAILKVTEAIAKNGDPINYLVAMKYLETFKEMVSGENNKTVYLPYEASGILSSIGGIKDLLKSS